MRKVINSLSNYMSTDYRQTEKTLKESRLWDEFFYLDLYPEVKKFNGKPLTHYIKFGAYEGRKPSVSFDTSYYMLTNPDVVSSKINPLYHYIVNGELENRKPNANFLPSEYLHSSIECQESQLGALEHFTIWGSKFDPSIEKTKDISLGEERKIKLTNKTEYQEKNFNIVDEKKIKPIAFYLPQYHPTKENDEWWGKGFTEWRNVGKATPLYEDHYQPKLPGEFGYYDLRVSNVLEEQVDLAKQAGLEGFCFYHYWFGGKKILDAPLKDYVKNERVDFPFCLCWANENWTKTWDGLENNVLMAQNYSPEDDLNFIKDITCYLKDKRYIRVNNKPLLIVYRPSLLPDAKATSKRWREYCLKNGIGEIYIVMVQFDKLSPKEFGFDASLEFPPHVVSGKNLASHFSLTNEDEFTGSVHDYNEMINNSINKIDAEPCFKGVTMEWDNTARRAGRASLFINSSPSKYKRWLQSARKKTIESKLPEPFVFINAWNEWAEGTYLEPDLKYGYSYLNETNKAIFTNAYSPPRIAVVLHVFYADLIDEIIQDLRNIPEDFDLLITTTKEIYADTFSKFNSEFSSSLVLVEVVENIGRDIAPFLTKFIKEYGRYEFICKIHTKKSLHAGGINNWRRFLLTRLLGNKEQVRLILNKFQENPKLGLLYPEYSEEIKPFIEWGSNYTECKQFLKDYNIEINEDDKIDIAAGSMFWFRPSSLKLLLDKQFKTHDFPKEKGQVDGTLQHVIERSILFLVMKNGFETGVIGTAKVMK
jgi:lipopolysaccharide biosynthesis protein